MPDVSDIIRGVFQPVGQVAAKPKRRIDSYKDQGSGGHAKDTVFTCHLEHSQMCTCAL